MNKSKKLYCIYFMNKFNIISIFAPRDWQNNKRSRKHSMQNNIDKPDLGVYLSDFSKV